MRSIIVERPWRNEVGSISVQAQRDRLGQLVGPGGHSGLLTSPVSIAVGSTPTDELAMAVGAAAARKALSLGLKVKVVDLGRRDPEVIRADLVLLHNVTAASHPVRHQLTRDWLVRLNCCVVLCVGDPPLAFGRQLRFRFDHYLSLEGEL